MALFPWLFISFYLDRFQLIKILVRTCVFKHRNRMWASSGLSPCEKHCSPHFLTTGPAACLCLSYRSPIGEPRLIQVGIRSYGQPQSSEGSGHTEQLGPLQQEGQGLKTVEIQWDSGAGAELPLLPISRDLSPLCQLWFTKCAVCWLFWGTLRS